MSLHVFSPICIRVWSGLWLVLTMAGFAAVESAPAISIIETTDQQYGSKIRRLRADAGHEHNLYYNRNPWNADGTRLILIHSDLAQQNWRVALHDGDGRFEKYLFTPAQFDWRIVWDRHDPDVLYTSHAAALFRYNVRTGEAQQLKRFSRPLRPTGASLNQAGDRILVATADWTFHSFALPRMDDERVFRPAVPPNYDSDKPAYTGHRNTIHVPYSAAGQQGILIYTDDGTLVHEFKDIGGGGHYDFSPDGRLAYFLLPLAATGKGRSLEVHVVNLDGTADRTLLRIPAEQMSYVQNLHLSWPDGLSDWFVASLFPNASRLPATYTPWLDEIVLIKLDGTHRILARSETAHARAAARGGVGDMFWAQPLASPSADGRRVLFNSSRDGTIDACILYVDR